MVRKTERKKKGGEEAENKEKKGKRELIRKDTRDDKEN